MSLKLNRELKTNLSRGRFELLVPAKNKETAFKAITAGADAVYTGYLKYGARAAAGNTLSDILETADFAHTYRAKVYVTLNTILYDKELNEIEKLIKKLYDIKIDGIIIQDMGILELDLPPVPLIASTQCHNNTIEKIQFLEKTGFKRVILPRETSLKEMQEIRKHTNIELECFIHGALCVSYSGQCFMSFINGGRSANRGECAQCCRKKYSLKDAEGRFISKDRHLLSLKDLNLSSHLEELILSGITSFKIEGRLKNESYVTNTAAYYSSRLDEILEKYSLERASIGKSTVSFTPDLNKSFNRGFTDFNLSGRTENIGTVNYTGSLGFYAGKAVNVKNSCFKLDSGHKFNNGDGICFFDKNNELTGSNINKTEGGFIYPASMKGIKEGIKIYCSYDKAFEDKMKTADLKRQLPAVLKIRETNTGLWFFLSDEEENTAVYGISSDFERAGNQENALNTLQKQLEKSGGTEFKINASDIKIKAAPYLKISQINEIRRILTEKLRRIRKKNYKPETGGAVKHNAPYPVKQLDYRADINNKKAEEFYKKHGAEVIEYSLEAGTSAAEKAVMISKYCLRNQLGMCRRKSADNKQAEKFKEPFTLIDEYKKEYDVIFDCSKCIMTIKTK